MTTRTTTHEQRQYDNDKNNGNGRRSGRDGKKDGRTTANLAAAGEQTSITNPYVNATEAETKSWLDNSQPKPQSHHEHDQIQIVMSSKHKS